MAWFRRLKKRHYSCLVGAVLLGLAAPVHPFLGSVSGAGGGAHAADGPPAFMGAARQFTLIRPAKEAPPLKLVDKDGKPVDAAQFKGRVLLVNFWATWCAPCVIEMPTLEKLQAEMGSKEFEVVTVAIDSRGIATVGPFWFRKGFRNLVLRLDSKGATYAAYGVRGLPTTVLIDHRGKIVGYLEGHADWASDKGKALIRYYLDRAKAAD